MTIPDMAMVNVFCHNGGGGNPTGLVLDARALSAAEMQALAQSCGHESGFVLPLENANSNADGADFRFRYFVPRHEMEMCGHATVGALWLLRRHGRIGEGTYRIATLSGAVTGFVGDRIAISQPLGTVAPADRFRSEILSVLGLDEDALADAPIENARTSRTKTLVPIVDPAVLNAITPDFAKVEALCDALGSTGLYPYAALSAGDGLFEARQFPRASGYPEDAATGIAATALASALLTRGCVAHPETGVVVYQGRAMGSLSEIRVRFASDSPGGSVTECRLSGDAQLAG